jgi:hypothetical protein
MLGLCVHGVASARIGLVSAVAAAAIALALASSSSAVDPSPDAPGIGGSVPSWPASPFHGVISGATGEVIPCRCRFRGNAYRLGDTVCMTTHLGVQLARCDLLLNNTSWVPIGVPCTISLLPRRQADDGRAGPTAVHAPGDGRSIARKNLTDG